MADSTETKLLLRRQITVKAVVTPLWKEDAQRQLQAQIDQIDGQLQQVDLQAQQIVAELKKQAAADAPELLNTRIQEVQAQVNTRQGELLQQKNNVLQQLDQVQRLEMEEEVNQGQMDNFFYAKQGDHLIQKMQVEILLRDGVIEQIRGTL
ncbi:YlqD family protein [Candidatus Synechococcus calcipolaris G9]|uniref:YlqD family protein n=1 Tax=Candidatus Synechococcus calcipolaris G9 TaxID=1497997 RepID=A0ABT6F1E7_9SYNE|nr:YlqD family protein [Candidatus Synechococcus calcipolaris]MDG2991606.1 YlqD family protein [Candidatus Synechococcus calcipolaris G9]